jgi:hypothetical protein
MRTIHVKRGDAGSVLEQRLLRGTSPIDLSGASVRFVMSREPGQSPKVDAAAEVIDPGAGLVRYRWQAEDLDEPGRYLGEWEVTFVGGGVETYPSRGWLRIVVVPDLA